MTTCTCGLGHATFGACLRAKNISVGYARSAKGLDASTQKTFDRGLDRYEAARKEGISPASTHPRDTEMAVRMSDKLGYAFKANADVPAGVMVDD